MGKINITLISILVNASTFGQTQIDYIRTNEYGRLRLPLNDFKKIISSIQYYHQETPSDSTELYNTASLRCDFSKKEKAITLSTFSQISEVEIDIDNYTNLVLLYSWNRKPISEVSLLFNNAYRILKVKGTDEKKVEALYRDIDNQLQLKQPFLSGINWNTTFSVISFVLFIFSIYLLQYLFGIIFSNKGNRKVYFLLTVTVLYTLLAIAIFFSSYNLSDFFPNFVLDSNSSSWIDKNANLFGFIGFIITLVSIIFSGVKWILKNK